MRRLTLILVACAACSSPAANPLLAATKERFGFDGEVTERLRAGSYTYLNVGGHWAVTLGDPPQSGRVHLTVFARSDDFHSARLGRDFSQLWFAAVQPVAEGASP